MRFDVHPTMMKQKQGAPCGRTLPKATDNSDMYNRAFPVGNALFLFVCTSSLCKLLSHFYFAAAPFLKQGGQQHETVRFFPAA